jgi:UPF0716 protein FxsA
MLSRLKILLLLIVLVDLALLGVIVYYTSWLLMLGFVFFSFIFGVWLLNDGLRRYAQKNIQAMKSNEISAESFLLGAVNRVAAGTLLIVPGVLTDILALLLISPAGNRLTRKFISTIFARLFPACSRDQFDFDSNAEKPAKDEIIDIRVKNPDAETSGNGHPDHI